MHSIKNNINQDTTNYFKCWHSSKINELENTGFTQLFVHYSFYFVNSFQTNQT